MSGAGLRSSVREQRAGKALRHGMNGQALRNKIRGAGITNAAGGGGRCSRSAPRGGRLPDCDSGDVGRQLDGGTREISDAGGPQEGKREIGATAIGAAFRGETSGVTPQNQDEDRNNEVQGHCCGADGSDDAHGLASVRKTRVQPTGTGAMRPMMPPWAGRRWRRRGRLFPGKHRSGEKIGRKQPEAPNSPRDNASAAFGDYRSLILGSLSLPPHTGMHSKSSQRVSRHVRTRVMIGMPKRRYRRRSTR